MKPVIWVSVILISFMAFSSAIKAELPSNEKLEDAENTFKRAFKKITGKGGVIDSTPESDVNEPAALKKPGQNEEPVDNISVKGQKTAKQALEFWQKNDENNFNQLLWDDVILCESDKPGLGKKAITAKPDTQNIISKQFLFQENLEKITSSVLDKMKYGGVKLKHIKKRLKTATDDFYYFIQFGEGQTEEILILGFQKREENYKVSYIEF